MFVENNVDFCHEIYLLLFFAVNTISVKKI